MSLAMRSRRDLLDIYNCALEAIKPERFVKKAIHFENDALTVKTSQESGGTHKVSNLSTRKVHVLGGGKSVLSMALGLGELVAKSGHRDLFSHGALSIPSGLEQGLDSCTMAKQFLSTISTDCFFGSKDNAPDLDSVSATRKILDKVQAACDSDRHEGKQPLFLVLLSGGGSACLSSPKLIGLDEKQDLISFLVKRGANIVELNKVRQCFSDIKAGGLANKILSSNPEAEVITLILSDVIGDPIASIASGPTFLPETQCDHKQQVQSMLSILEKFGYDFSKLPLESLQPIGDSHIDHHAKVFNYIIGSNLTALSVVEARIEALGYKPVCLGRELQGTTTKLVKQLIEAGRLHSNLDKVIVFGGGEATVEKMPKDSWGKGGRLQEMAIDYIIEKYINSRENRDGIAQDMFLGASTDGQDGPTDVAACIVSFNELDPSNRESLFREAMKAKSEHNSYHFWDKHLPEKLVRTGLTGTNVMDLYIYLLADENQQLARD